MANTSDVNNFKKIMAYLESSNGKNTKHQPITQGMHAGTTAVGPYGQLPIPIKEMAKRAPASSPLDSLLKDAPLDTVQNIVKENPEVQDEYADRMANKLLDKTHGDPNLAAVAWRYGQNLPNSELKAKMTPEYQQRIDSAIGDQHLQSTQPTYLDTILARKNKLYKLQSMMPQNSTAAPVEPDESDSEGS